MSVKGATVLLEKKYGKIVSRLRGNALIKDSFWALVGSVLGKGLSLVAGIIVARLLGSEAYGEFGTIKVTLTYIAIVSTLGFGYTATKYIAEYSLKQPQKIISLVGAIYRITISFSTFLALLLFIFAEQVALFIDAPHLSFILQVSAIIVITNALNTAQIGILSGFKMFKELAKINIFAGLITFLSSILFSYFWGVDGAVYSLLISFFYQVISNEVFIRKKLRKYLSSSFKVQPQEVKEMLFFSLPIAMQESLYTIVHWLSVLLLIKYANYIEVGIASAASLWQSIVIFIPSVLKNVMFSYLMSSSDHKKMVDKMLLINFFSSVASIFIILSFSKLICNFYGESFIGLFPVFFVSVLTSIPICLSEVYCYEFISVGKPWFVFSSRLIRDVLILFLGASLVLNMSDNQAFWLSLSSLVMNSVFLFVLYFLYKRFHVSEYHK
ncbi:oligosaccharide flippase family protein [Bacteroides pyogenes]|uniref:oligosaccharide flippase family protein n=1 Tax=Bacteroides pyogenes TaxID=310300 RepID=UPI0003DC74EF|nr:oligosaccharide flippase family protein [Bacteroides pyogenes]MBB3894811.1 O-antigen/teichoic acid export membrane protein [Bacteroides pyogenes]GAE21180.1 putative lipopolysaccharide biosynthesis protein WzxE [Bacteroides pyogenes JCM 10003]SUV35269.1 putative polysaccharide transporter/flippase [Bacteroides pyogenes]